MRPLRLSFRATLVAAFCAATASALLDADAVASRAIARDAIADASFSPEGLVRVVTSGMLEAAGMAEPRGQRNDAWTPAEARVLAHLDFVESTRLAAGSAWTHANASQQAQLAAAFRPMLVRGYLEALRPHGGQTLAVLPGKTDARRPDDITVQSRLEGRQGAPLTVEYALHRRGGEWKIYDIRIDGQSLAASCRPVFEQVARTEGIRGLIRRMKGNTRARPVIAT